MQGKICFESVTHASVFFLFFNKLFKKFYFDNPYSVVCRHSVLMCLPKPVSLFFDRGELTSSFFFPVTLYFLWHIYLTLVVRIITKVSKLNLLIGFFNDTFFFDITNSTILNHIYYESFNEIILDSFFLKNLIDFNYYTSQAFAEWDEYCRIAFFTCRYEIYLPY